MISVFDPSLLVVDFVKNNPLANYIAATLRGTILPIVSYNRNVLAKHAFRPNSPESKLPTVEPVIV